MTTQPIAGTIPLDETALDCIIRSCHDIDRLHPPATITGDRVRGLTRDIRQAAEQMVREHDVTASLLRDAQEDLQAAGGDGP